MWDPVLTNPHSQRLFQHPTLAELGQAIHACGPLPAAACLGELTAGGPRINPPRLVLGGAITSTELSRLLGETTFLERHCHTPAVCIVTAAASRHRALLVDDDLYPHLTFHFYGAGSLTADLKRLVAAANAPRRPDQQHTVHTEPFEWKHANGYAMAYRQGPRLLLLQTDRPLELVDKNKARLCDWLFTNVGLVRTLRSGAQLEAALLAFRHDLDMSFLPGPARLPIFAELGSQWGWVEVDRDAAAAPLVRRPSLTLQLAYFHHVARPSIYRCERPDDLELYVAGSPLDACGDCCRYWAHLRQLCARTGRPFSELHQALSGSSA